MKSTFKISIQLPFLIMTKLLLKLNAYPLVTEDMNHSRK